MHELVCALLLGLMIAWLSTLSSQASSRWSCHTWGTDDGIPNNDIAQVFQGPGQMLWIWSLGGSVRFDGKSFYPISWKGLSRDAHAACFSRDGSCWVVTNRSLQRWRDGQMIQAYPFPNDMALSRITHLFEDTNGFLWISADFGHLFRLEGEKLNRVAPPLGMDQSFGSMALETSKHEVWVVGNQMLAKWDGEKLVTEVKLNLKHRHARIAEAREGGFWIAAGNEVYRYNQSLSLHVRIDDLPPGANISLIREDEHGRLWIGTNGDGLYVWENQKLEKIDLPNQDVWSICFTHDQQVWVGTGGGGLCLVYPRTLSWLESEGAIVKQTVRSMCRDRQGNIWMVFQTGIIYAQWQGSWRYLHPHKDWQGDNAMSIIADPHEGVWLATTSGKILRFQNGEFQRIETEIEGNSMGRVRAMVFDAEGLLWLGGLRLAHQQADGSWMELPLSSHVGDVQTMVLDLSGHVVAGTQNGNLLSMQGNQVLDITPPKLSHSGGIRSILTLDDMMLMGTGGAGLWIKKGDYWHDMRAENGLWDQSIHQMAVDERHRLWMAGEKGISLMEGKSLEDFVGGRSSRIVSQSMAHRSEASNLQANTGYSPASFVDAQGKLWFSMRGGILFVDPTTVERNELPPVASVQTYEIDGRNHSPMNGVLTVGQDARNIRFGLSATEFQHPESARIQYRMEHVDSNWVEAGKERVASYASLPPGYHRFLLRAANADGVWSEPVMVFRLEVPLYFWQHAWFPYAGIFTIVALSVAMAQVHAARSLRRKTLAMQRESALDRERTRISRDMHDQIGASLTRINLITELMRGEVHADEHLNRLSQTAREAVVSLDEIVWAINPRHDNVNSLIEYIGQQTIDQLHETNIRCRLEFPPHIPELSVSADLRHQLFLMTREAVNNAVKYANASEITLSAHMLGKCIEIVVSDNGKGFDETQVSGNGLRHMKERAQELEGSCLIDSRPGSGTRITFKIPLQRTFLS